MSSISVALGVRARGAQGHEALSKMFFYGPQGHVCLRLVFGMLLVETKNGILSAGDPRA